jgi:hypothetical protein
MITLIEHTPNAYIIAHNENIESLFSFLYGEGFNCAVMRGAL